MVSLTDEVVMRHTLNLIVHTLQDLAWNRLWASSDGKWQVVAKKPPND